MASILFMTMLFVAGVIGGVITQTPHFKTDKGEVDSDAWAMWGGSQAIALVFAVFGMTEALGFVVGSGIGIAAGWGGRLTGPYARLYALKKAKGLTRTKLLETDEEKISRLAVMRRAEESRARISSTLEGCSGRAQVVELNGEIARLIDEDLRDLIIRRTDLRAALNESVPIRDQLVRSNVLPQDLIDDLHSDVDGFKTAQREVDTAVRTILDLLDKLSVDAHQIKLATSGSGDIDELLRRVQDVHSLTDNILDVERDVEDMFSTRRRRFKKKSEMLAESDREAKDTTKVRPAMRVKK